LVDEFTLAKQIITMGIDLKDVTGTVLKNEIPIKHMTITIVDTNKITQTDTDGNYTISKIKTGDYAVQATNKAGEIQTKKGNITRSNFEVKTSIFYTNLNI
jgi:hypothetical protein